MTLCSARSRAANSMTDGRALMSRSVGLREDMDERAEVDLLERRTRHPPLGPRRASSTAGRAPSGCKDRVVHRLRKRYQDRPSAIVGRLQQVDEAVASAPTSSMTIAQLDEVAGCA